MDCEFFRSVPSLDQYQRPTPKSVHTGVNKVPSVPVKKRGSKR